MTERQLTSRRPYLIRAMREWMIDNGLTPQIVVDAGAPGVKVPEAFVQEGRIVLNVSDAATQGMVLGNDRIAFSARFGGTPREVSFPVTAVLVIYARETEHGMVFGADPAGEDGAGRADDDASPPDGDDDGPGGGRRPGHLKVVK